MVRRPELRHPRANRRLIREVIEIDARLECLAAMAERFPQADVELIEVWISDRSALGHDDRLRALRQRDRVVSNRNGGVLRETFLMLERSARRDSPRQLVQA